MNVLEKRLRTAGLLVATGLAIEVATLFFVGAEPFMVFAGGGVLLVGAGIAWYLYAILRAQPEEHP
jgi:hypothetical protein